MSTQGKRIITRDSAAAYLQNYLETATPTNDVIKAIVVDTEMLDSMNAIMQQNPNTQGFRIYNGIDENGAAVSMVVGIHDNADEELPVYSTGRTGSNLCPPMCDASGTGITGG